jgi:hypothetical protein
MPELLSASAMATEQKVSSLYPANQDGSDLRSLLCLPDEDLLSRHIQRARTWWQSVGQPRYVCAPMVWNSEAAFRRLVRKHGCQLTVRLP